LLAFHLAFISFNFATVSLIRDGLALSEEAAVAAGADWAIAAGSGLATSAAAMRQTQIRTMQSSKN
jgi:hypothetical protein